MTAPQTPGPARPPGAGAGPRVPAPPDDAAGGAGDPAIDLDDMRTPTDSESGDAPHNPDVWTLRSHIERLAVVVERLVGERDEARADVARLSALLVQAEDYAREAGDRETEADEACNRQMVAAERAEAAVERVRAKHVARTARDCTGCVACGQLWPCSTLRALDPPAPSGGAT